MALLSFLHTEPPDGYRFLERTSQVWIRCELWDELVAAVIAHRQHKGLTPTDKETVELEIQRQICLGAPSGACHPERGEDYRPFQDNARTLSLAKIEAASTTLMAWLKAGMQMVAKPHAEARAQVCRGCPFNRPVPNCVCTTFWKAIDLMVPAERKEPGLFVCGICGCANSVKALAPIDVVLEGADPTLRLPDWCWQRTENPAVNNFL